MRIRQSEEVCTVDFAETTVIFDLRTYRSFILNETAALVWNFSKRPRGANQIATFLSRKYKLGLSKALKDTAKLARQLEKRKLLVSSELS